MAQALLPFDFLFVLAGVAFLLLELKVHGALVFGAAGVICFVVFFWVHAQPGGPLLLLALALLLVGAALLGVEIFLIPGFGITGVSGVLLVLAGLDQAPAGVAADWGEFARRTLRYGLALAGGGVLAFIAAEHLPDIPFANRLVLASPADRPDDGPDCDLPGAASAAGLLGRVGTAESTLGMAGKARFGDRRVDVVARGEFLPAGTPIRVIEVEGPRIIVRRL